MTAPPETSEGTLSPWWRRAVIATMAIGFAVLILLTAKAYQNAPPIPGCRRSFGEGGLHQRRNRARPAGLSMSLDGDQSFFPQ
jgi:hypothetical protein